jgi:hypothetical protein
MAKETQTSEPNPLLLTPEQLVEILKQARLSPEEINELKKPYVDHEFEARRLATRRQMQADQQDMLRAQQQVQENCPHEKRLMNGTISNKIMLVHNFPDGHPRGICLLCRRVWHPRRWEFVGADRKQVEVPASEGYDKIVKLEQYANEPVM